MDQDVAMSQNQQAPTETVQRLADKRSEQKAGPKVTQPLARKGETAENGVTPTPHTHTHILISIFGLFYLYVRTTS